MKFTEVDKAVEMVGGHFQLTALLQKRSIELIRGARPLVETKRVHPKDIALQELLAGKIRLVEGEDVPEPQVDSPLGPIESPLLESSLEASAAGEMVGAETEPDEAATAVASESDEDAEEEDAGDDDGDDGDEGEDGDGEEE